MDMSSVIIKNVSKKYGDLAVLKDISLNIQDGSFVTLLGPSGCGKSTLLKCIAGLMPIESGHIYFGSKDVTHMPPQKRNIGMVFQHYALFHNLTVFDNIAFGLEVKKEEKKRMNEQVFEMIEWVGLSGKEKAYPHQLSGGQKQRVALARALVLKPDILLLDEPLSALDAKIRKQLRLLIRDIQKRLKITTIFVTHDQEEALIVSDEIFVMDAGKITQSGSSESIYTAPANDFVAGFIGHYNIVEPRHLSGIPMSPQTGRFALRPEVIALSKPQASSAPVFMVKDVILLGSTIRYVVSVEGSDWCVDALNTHDERTFNVGDAVCLNFSPSALKRIG